MAVPAEYTSADFSGTFYLNKTLTGDFTGVLQLQGIGWIKRKAIAAAGVSIHANIKNYKDDEGVEHVIADQTVAGVANNREQRTLTWKEDTVEDPVFGWVTSKSRRILPDELDVPFLKEGWTAETREHGLVQSYVTSVTAKSGTTWTSNQVWGVEVINGERRYVGHHKFTGPKGEDKEVKMVYDYAGPSAK